MNLPLSIFKTDQEIFSQAIATAETGMGYQAINIRFVGRSYVSMSSFLVNAHYLFEYENYNNLPLFLSVEQLPPLKTLQSTVASFSVMTNLRFSLSPTEELPPFTYYSQPGDVFIRLSAFKDDKRILSDGSVLAGTYATTTTDMVVTPSGLAAVARYALPNRLSAYYVYRIIPPIDTPVLFGTVMPNYGLCGGGVEVFFPKGCSKGSAILYETIPQR